MSKGAATMSAIAVVVTGGYFAYDYYDSHKKKSKTPSATKAPGSVGTGSSRGSQAGSGPGSETAPGSQAGSQAGSEAGSQPGSEAGSQPGSGSGSEVEPVLHKVHEIALPNLTGKTLDEAKTVLIGLGFKDDVLETPPDMACVYEDERHPVPVGTICNTERSAGTKVMSNAKIRVVVEHDTWEHGGVEAGMEWHRMPDLIGMPLSRAKDLLRTKGFGDDEFEIGEPRTNCGSGLVCEQTPKPDGRKYVSTKGSLGVGN